MIITNQAELLTAERELQSEILKDPISVRRMEIQIAISNYESSKNTIKK